MKILMMASATANAILTYRIVSFARHLVARGHEVTIVALTADKYSGFQPETFKQLDGIRIVRPWQPFPKYFTLSLLFYLFSAAWQVLRRPSDVVYLYKPTPISIVGLLAKFWRRTPVILDMDDLGSEVMRLEGHTGWQVKLVAGCERLAARHAKAIVVVSQYLQQRFRQQFPGKPVHWISNGTDVEALQAAAQAPADKTVQIVMLGSIDRTDIIEPVLRALPTVLAQLPGQPIKLALVGDGPLRGYFKDLAKELGIADSVVWSDRWITKAEFGDFIKIGDIGYCYTPNNPTTQACSNMKVFDYMALGAAVLVSDVGDLPAYVDGGKAGYIVPAGDQQALEQQLVAALGDAKRQQKIARAQKRVTRHYDWSVLSEKVEAVCQEVTRRG